MNQNYNCVKEFVESAGLAREWQMGMATAALEMNLTVQWCYATPTDILGALEMPSVTNFRVRPSPAQSSLDQPSKRRTVLDLFYEFRRADSRSPMISATARAGR